MKAKLYWNQWAFGFMVDWGRIIHKRWFVILLGPLAISIPIGYANDR